MYIKVLVEAGSKKEYFEQKDRTHFLIKVREKAQANLANKRVVELIAEHFKVNKGSVRIVNGHHSPSKLLHITS